MVSLIKTGSGGRGRPTVKRRRRVQYEVKRAGEWISVDWATECPNGQLSYQFGNVTVFAAADHWRYRAPLPVPSAPQDPPPSMTTQVVPPISGLVQFYEKGWRTAQVDEVVGSDVWIRPLPPYGKRIENQPSFAVKLSEIRPVNADETKYIAPAPKISEVNHEENQTMATHAKKAKKVKVAKESKSRVVKTFKALKAAAETECRGHMETIRAFMVKADKALTVDEIAAGAGVDRKVVSDYTWHLRNKKLIAEA